jgi:catechol-2,3-dioxygenase
MALGSVEPGHYRNANSNPKENHVMIKPKFHHVYLKTTRLQEMIDWYAIVVGTKVNFQSNNIAFTSNDNASHRIAFLAVPGLRNDPEKVVHTGIHHTAFEYDSFDDLMSSFARLKQFGIKPEFCLNHGMTTSLYYCDPDQNLVELQVDNFGKWEASTEWMRTLGAFPIGAFFDPDRVLAAYQAGATFEQLQKDTSAGIYPPSKPPNLHLPPLG